jgi:hypothetical protein
VTSAARYPDNNCVQHYSSEVRYKSESALKQARTAPKLAFMFTATLLNINEDIQGKWRK